MSMKKRFYFNIFVSVTALMGAMVFTSCGQDDVYSETNAERIANDKYAAAFEKAFGKVGSDVDWGFSSKSANARLTRAASDYATTKGNIQPTFDYPFPEDCDASHFIKEADIPTTAVPMPNYQGGAGPYYIDANTTQVDSWSANCVIYVKGDVDMSDKTFSLQPGATIYLPEGTSLKLSAEQAGDYHFVTYIAPGAQLLTDGKLYADNKSKVYNHGTITSNGGFTANADGFLYNVGELTTGAMTAESNTSRIVNDGEINAASVTVNAGAVQNNAEWTVTGTTHINSEKSGWVNNGHWKTLNYAYIGGSENVINNCFLEVTNDFEMNIDSAEGAFKMDAGCGVVTKNFYGGRDSSTGAKSGPFKILMGTNSVFKVTETAVLESGRGSTATDGKPYNGGFYVNATDGYSVFQAKKIVREPSIASTNPWGAVTYSGNLYVYAEETHFEQGGSETQPAIIAEGGFSIDTNIYADGFQAGKPDITIEATACCPGFEGGTPLYRVIAEDLSASEAGDFDFNDVVFDVVKAEGGKTILRLICAGGTLPLRVRGANEPVGTEIHSVFGQSEPNAKGEYSMYNTGAGPTVPEAEFTVEGTYTTPEEIKNIIIEVKKNDVWMTLDATRGKAACKILVDDTFIPVRERRNIADENKLFTNYVQGAFVNDFWWK